MSVYWSVNCVSGILISGRHTFETNGHSHLPLETELREKHS